MKKIKNPTKTGKICPLMKCECVGDDCMWCHTNYESVGEAVLESYVCSIAVISAAYWGDEGYEEVEEEC